MARYRITSPDGGTVEVTAPDDASPDEVMQYVQSQTAAPEREKTGAVSAVLQGAGQGLSFGFSDELEGAARGAYDAATSGKSFSDAYNERVGAARKRQNEAAEDQPLAYYGGEIASAFAVPGGLARVGIRGATAGAANLGLRARTGAAIREGAAYGGVYGAGMSEGGLEERAIGAAKGAAMGGAVGSVMPAAVDAGSALVRRGIMNPVRGYADPRGIASEKFGEALARDMGASGNPNNIFAAAGRVDARAAAVADDPTMMLADIGGENTRRLVRQAADMPNDNVQRLNRTLDRRQATAPGRIERGFAQALGDPTEYAETLGEVIARRSQQAAGDFRAAEAVDIAMTPELSSVLQRPAMQTIMRNVEASLANEGQAIGRQTRMQALHKLKVELDNQIGQARRAQAMGNDRTAGMDARTLQILKNDLLGAIDNPTYRRALDNFAGESALANAAEDGFERALTMHTEEIAPMLARMTDGEREMWRLGAARALAGKVRKGNKMHDRTDRDFSSPDIEQRMRSIFPSNRERREFQRVLVREARKADTRKAVQGGSKTSQNLTTADEAGAPMRAANAMSQMARGNFWEPAMAALGRVGNRFSGLTPGSANAMLEIAMRRAADGMDPEVFNAMARAAQRPGDRARLARRLIAGSSTPAGALGSSYDQNDGLVGRQTTGAYPPGDPRWRE
jgi:hypothetical protein